jgi:hypothetical protein
MNLGVPGSTSPDAAYGCQNHTPVLLPPSRGKVDRAAGARRMRGLFQGVLAEIVLAEPPPHPALRATFPREGGRECGGRPQ